VKAIRRSLRMSQHRFAEAFRFPRSRTGSKGDGIPMLLPAADLLAIKRRPKEIMEAVAASLQVLDTRLGHAANVLMAICDQAMRGAHLRSDAEIVFLPRDRRRDL
jgi:hypothetical protein